MKPYDAAKRVREQRGAPPRVVRPSSPETPYTRDAPLVAGPEVADAQRLLALLVQPTRAPRRENMVIRGGQQAFLS